MIRLIVTLGGENQALSIARAGISYYAYCMSRTTIVLDHPSETALSALTKHYGCSASEAVRRALVQHRERTLGVPEEKRQRRRAALEQLVRLMDGHDWQAEIERLKNEDAWS
ncbi:MAG: hypothetical protein ACRETX_16180 [Steroidobacteraceae bacterium]